MLPKNDTDTGVTIGKLVVKADFTHIFCITPTATGIKIKPWLSVQDRNSKSTCCNFATVA